MPPTNELVLWLGVFLVALSYSCVGHGGASGYLALLAFTAFTSREASTLALLMNVGVSAIAFIIYHRARHFDVKLAWPFFVLSIPMAYLGAVFKLSDSVHRWVLAAALLGAAAALIFRPTRTEEPGKPVAIPIALILGASIGLLSGMIGIGGGIFLSPVLIIMGWADAKKTAAISSAFIFLNSASGIVARTSEVAPMASRHWPLIVIAVVGAVVGGIIGANRMAPTTLRRALGVVLLFAIPKLFM